MILIVNETKKWVVKKLKNTKIKFAFREMNFYNFDLRNVNWSSLE